MTTRRIIFHCCSCEKEMAEFNPYPTWSLGPFKKLDDVNPVFGPGEGVFSCPFLGPVKWEDRGICNPAAVIRDKKLYLIYRAMGSAGFTRGISRLGLAWSEDGIHFQHRPEPILYPEDGPWKDLEFGTGLQDPRLVETEDGKYILTYALFDLKNCYLMVATSDDLFHWQKHGLAFDGKYRETWSKAGAIVCRREGSRMIATKVNGKYWMYWGESEIYAATSDDLIHWTPVEMEVEARKGVYLDEHQVWRERWDRGRMVLRPLIAPRPGRFDGALVEPGPQAILTKDGILLIYNGCNAGDPSLPPGAYTAGQVLFDPIDPTAVIGRSEHPFLIPNQPFELVGEIENVCFTNGLAYFDDRWLLYYGAADKFIGVCAAFPVQKIG
jgi:predicted GH43/DUF377 family glycosyl hydrolase